MTIGIFISFFMAIGSQPSAVSKEVSGAPSFLLTMVKPKNM
jgi:hypothetical protein